MSFLKQFFSPGGTPTPPSPAVASTTATPQPPNQPSITNTPTHHQVSPHEAARAMRMQAPPAKPHPQAFMQQLASPQSNGLTRLHSRTTSVTSSQQQQQPTTPPTARRGASQVSTDPPSITTPTAPQAKVIHSTAAPATAPDTSSFDLFGGLSLRAESESDSTPPRERQAEAVPAPSLPPVTEQAADAAPSSSFSFLTESEPTSPVAERQAAVPAALSPVADSAFAFLGSAEGDDTNADTAVVDNTDAVSIDSLTSATQYAAKHNRIDSQPASTYSDSPKHQRYTLDDAAVTIQSPEAFSSPNATNSPHSGPPIIAEIEQLNTQIDTLLAEHWQSWHSLTQQQQSMQTQLDALLASVSADEQQVAALEQQQQTAIETEDFEGADALNAEIDRVRQQITQHRNEADSVRTQTANSSNTGPKQQLNDSLTAKLKTYAQQLQDLQSRQINSISTHNSSVQRQLETQEDEILARGERVAQTLKRNEADLAEADAELAAIEHTIETDTAGIQSEREGLQADAAKLELEIDSLRRQLAEKEAEMSVLQSKLDANSQSITAARQQHERRLKRAGEKRQRIVQEQYQSEQTRAALERQREKVQQQLADMKTAEERAGALVCSIEADISDALLAVQHLSTSTATDSSAVETPAHAQLREARQRTSQLQKELSDVEADLVAQQAIIANATSRAPILDAEKHAAVTARDFKRAAAASKEVKELAEAKVNATAAISRLQQQAAELQQQLEAQRATEQQLQDEVLQAESSTDLAQYKTLAQQLDTIQSQADKVRERTGSAMEQGASSNRHVDAYLTALSAEIAALQQQVSALKQKHNWSDDQLAEADPTGGQAVEEQAVVLQPTSTDSATADAQLSTITDTIEPPQSEPTTPIADAVPAIDIAALRGELKQLAAEREKINTQLEEAIASEQFDQADVLDAQQLQMQARIHELELQLTLAGVDDDSAEAGAAPEKLATTSTDSATNGVHVPHSNGVTIEDDDDIGL